MANTTALARKFRVDISSDLTGAGGWTQLKGIYALKPSIDPNTVETSSYDTAGWDSFEITGNAWGLTASFYRRTTSGVYDPGQELLRARIGQFGDSARVAVRWYDVDGGDESYEGVAIVKWERANDGVKDVDAATVTLMGDGELDLDYANPGVAAAAPVLTSALPSAAAEGELVTITGSNFTGATDVNFGATDAGDFTVVTDSVIVASVPAGTAGAANITVVNPAGTSSALSYTRGA